MEVSSPISCTSEQLFTVVSSQNSNWLLLALSNPAMTEDHVIALLRNPRVTTEIIHNIADRLDWASSYRIQVALVNCPKTATASAMRLMQMLFWNDLVKTAANYRITPQLRRLAENHLREKIPSLTMGEKISLAKTGPRNVITTFRIEKELKIVQALLRNPQLLEDDVLVMINNDRTPAATLGTIAADYKWSVRYPIRLALVRNEKTPLSFVLSSLSKLKKTDLQSLIHAPGIAELVRRSAERIVEGKY
jgi:hypothetical protein